MLSGSCHGLQRSASARRGYWTEAVRVLKSSGVAERGLCDLRKLSQKVLKDGKLVMLAAMLNVETAIGSITIVWNSSLNKEQTNLSKLNIAHPTVKMPASASK